MLVEGKAKVMDVGHRVVRDVLGGEGGGSHVGDLLKEETCRAIDEESKGGRKRFREEIFQKKQGLRMKIKEGRWKDLVRGKGIDGKKGQT